MAVMEGLASAVDAVVAQDVSVLSIVELQEQFALLASSTSRLAGFEAALLAELAHRTGGLLPTEEGRPRPLAGWAADACADTPSAAGRRMRIGTALQSGLPPVAAAVLDGRVGWRQAQVLTRLVGKIDPADLAEAAPSLIVAARAMNPEQLAAWVSHQLATWVEPLLNDQETAGQAKRYLKTRRNADGSLWGSFLLPAGDGETLLTTIEPLARRQGAEDSRSAGQRRADALSEVCEQVLRHGTLPDAGGLRPQLNYVLPADWAARRADERDCSQCTRCPQHSPVGFADLIAAGVLGSDARDNAYGGRVLPAEHRCAVAAWTGPQTRARIETMLCDARISKVLLDHLGQVTAMEQLTDQVTSRQRRALAARDLGCAVRGCTRPPAMCDAHHLTARADGGPTTLANLVLLCRRHHVLWHLGKITLQELHVPWLTRPDAGPPAPPPRQPADVAAERLRCAFRDG